MDTNEKHLLDSLHHYEKQLLDNRVKRIRSVLAQRTLCVIPILENIYDQGNIHAVTRTAENLGIQEMHIIASKRLKKSHRITRGCEKWMDVLTFVDIQSCIENLKKREYTIIATALGKNTIDLEESIPLLKNKKLAVIFGNEHSGVSEQAQSLCDYIIKISNFGFSQSYNISVAAAIVLYEYTKHNRGQKLTNHEFDHKLLEWYQRKSYH